MSFKVKYFTVRVSGIEKVTKVSAKVIDGIVYEDDVLRAAQEAFAPYGGLRKRPAKRKAAVLPKTAE